MRGMLTIKGRSAFFTANIELIPDCRLHDVVLKSGRKRLQAKVRQIDGPDGLVDCFVYKGQQRHVAFNLGKVAGEKRVTRTGHRHSDEKGWGTFAKGWSCTFTPAP